MIALLMIAVGVYLNALTINHQLGAGGKGPNRLFPRIPSASNSNSTDWQQEMSS